MNLRLIDFDIDRIKDFPAVKNQEKTVPKVVLHLHYLGILAHLDHC